MYSKPTVAIPPEQRATLDIPSAAQFLSIGRTSIYKMMRDGRLPSTKIAGRRLIPRHALEGLMRDGMSA
jgi:excisionase family DNA binding protein